MIFQLKIKVLVVVNSKYGFNPAPVIRTQPVGTQPDCDHNGGARWGQRVNAILDGDSAHSGQG